MGPDCGTAIIGGKPLAFANVVRGGKVGIVGASGTGIQAVTVLVDRYGAGISHAIGTGGRDVKDAVGGIMFLAGIQALEEDPETQVILLVAKPPGEKTAAEIRRRVAACQKPTVICLLGGSVDENTVDGVYYATDLEAAARTASTLALGHDVSDLPAPAVDWNTVASRFAPQQRYLRGLYSGGTLCDETMLMLRDCGVTIWSNTPIKGGRQLENGRVSHEHTVVDLGDDEFTRGKPHPMIDPSTRAQRIVAEMADPEVAVLMVDVVLGFGSHADPAGAVADAIREGRRARAAGEVCIIASVCGTQGDRQNLERQEAVLREAGVLVYPSNTAAARAAAELLAHVERRLSHV
jgi:FdrA protein